MQSDETTGGRLELSVQRARLLMGAPGEASHLESSEGGGRVRVGPPGDQDRREIATRIRAARGIQPVVMVGQSPDDDADALATLMVARANNLLTELRAGKSPGAITDDDAVAFEAVLQVRGRPALRVQERIEPIDDDLHPGSGFWRPFFDEHELQLLKVAAAAGAVVARDRQGSSTWVQGTAWLIASDLVVTNRHVLFPPPPGVMLASRLTGAANSARLKTNMEVTIDFAHDNGPVRNVVYAIENIPFVSDERDPVDVALIRVKPTSAVAKPQPLQLATVPHTQPYIYVVGHPGVVPNVPQKVLAVFGTPDERKRVSFGEVMRSDAPRPGEILHDASTIGGYSGGCILGFGNPDVLALHYYGHPLSGNRAFTAETLRSHAVSKFI